MASLSIMGFGAILQIGDDGTPPDTPPTSWTDISEVISCPDNLGGEDRNAHDDSSHGPSIFSTQNLGRVPPVTYEFECNFIDSQYQTLWDLYTAPVSETKWWRVILPTTPTLQSVFFMAKVKGLPINPPLDGIVTYMLRLAVVDTIAYETVI